MYEFCLMITYDIKKILANHVLKLNFGFHGNCLKIFVDHKVNSILYSSELRLTAVTFFIALKLL